jgi:O-antigen/teichoic acid export membrane protein
MVVSALARWGLWFALLARVCRNRGVPITLRDALKERQVLFGFAIPAALGGFSSMPALWAGNAILVRQGRDLAQMAYFGAAMNLKTLILFMPLVIDGVSTALLNRERGAGDQQTFRRMFTLNLATTSVVAAALTVGSGLFAHPLMALFGSDFAAGAAIFRVLAVAACVQALMSPFYQLIQSRGRMWFSLFAVVLPRDALMVVLAFLLTSGYGAIGLAWAQLLAWILAFAVVFAATRGWRREAK